jgi:hypothetical protein
MAGEVVEIVGLAEFRRDLKRAGESTKDLTAAMKKAGAPVLAKAATYAPRGGEGDPHAGQLAGSGKISAAGSKGRVIFKPYYAPGAEFGAHGRWQGFDKWGSPPRFGYRALAESSEQVFQIVTTELNDMLTVFGWFHE